MKKILYILFFLSLSLNNISYAESNLEKLKNKIKATEDKLVGKLWGTKDCSQYSTRTMSGLADYKRCKKGLEPLEKKSIFKSLGFKGKKNKEFDPDKPCDEYSTKTFTGLAAKMKCKRAKKN
tara:strand:- start:111 stop:476 length:366 start_codon:yes stop_codon:yes gene_type:complete